MTDYNIKLGVRFVRRDIERVLEDMSGITVEQANSDNPPQQIYVIGNPLSDEAKTKQLEALKSYGVRINQQ